MKDEKEFLEDLCRKVDALKVASGELAADPRLRMLAEVQGQVTGRLVEIAKAGVPHA